MFKQRVTVEDASRLLDFNTEQDMVDAFASHGMKPFLDPATDGSCDLASLIMLKLSLALEDVGVALEKTLPYAEAILNSAVFSDENLVMQWLNTGSQELHCLLEDGQLARVFLRGEEDDKEIEVAAVKPILLPTTRCEINLSRVIRPIFYRAKQLPSAGARAGVD